MDYKQKFLPTKSGSCTTTARGGGVFEFWHAKVFIFLLTSLLIFVTNVPCKTLYKGSLSDSKIDCMDQYGSDERKCAVP